MPSIPDAIAWYDANAGAQAPLYESLQAADVLGWVADLLPAVPGVIIDIGAGTGRDAAWLASLGHDVLAIEPSAAMRAEGERSHLDPRIRWFDDRLPSLSSTTRLGVAADAVLLSAVWMHVPPADRPRAFRKAVSLLRSGGLMAITLREGPAEEARSMHPVSVEEIETLARGHGLSVVRVQRSDDRLGRSEVSWTYVALRLPDDRTGALSLIRHVILHDDKNSTYKLGLLRALCRAADGSAGMAQDAGDDHVALPMGLVALNWIRLYLPLLLADLPQRVTNTNGAEQLGFAKDGFRALMEGAASQLDLRMGIVLGPVAGRAVHVALRDAADTIARMPAHHMTYANDAPILLVSRGRAAPISDRIALDAAYLWSFGEMKVPRDLWIALQRFSCWVEPSLIAEWTRLMRGYARSQRRILDEGRIGVAMTWSDPARDVSVSRSIALQMMEAGRPVHCVWTGRHLEASSLEMDHCFPWAAWPCGDLWNLLPSHRQANQRKRDRMPSEELMRRAGDSIAEWWRAGYLSRQDPILPHRFGEEAKASLPALSASPGAPEADDVLFAMGLQRLRLLHDQQVPEWDGLRSPRGTTSNPARPFIDPD